MTLSRYAARKWRDGTLATTIMFIRFGLSRSRRLQVSLVKAERVNGSVTLLVSVRLAVTCEHEEAATQTLPKPSGQLNQSQSPWASWA